jgi:hypothetical protein
MPGSFRIMHLLQVLRVEVLLVVAVVVALPAPGLATIFCLRARSSDMV